MPRLFVVAVALASCAMPAGTADRPDTSVSVARVLDGDSLVLNTPGGEVDVRLSGVNAPERGECHHAEAAEVLGGLVEVARVSLTIEGTDQFGRSLGRLSADGIDVAMEMVGGGHGIAVAEAANSAELVAAEDAAHAKGLGMWASEACGIGPLPLLRFVPGSSRPDPPGPDGEVLRAEVVALMNGHGRAVDLSGWTVRDGSSLHRYRFAAGTVLDPGAIMEIDSADPGWRPGRSPVWSNQGDIAILLDPSGRVVARWRY